MPYTEIYRHGSLGSALIDTIDDMIVAGRLAPQLGKLVLESFDRVMCRDLGRQTRATMAFKGRLDMYRLCDNIWTFELKDVMFRMNRGSRYARGTVVEAKRVKIISCGADHST